MATDSFFLDTAYVIALLNPHDSYHEKAKRLLSQISIAQKVWTTESVLTEVGNTFARTNRSAAIAFINSCYRKKFKLIPFCS